MRTCEEYELLISEFLDGTLSEHERAELAEHLTACPRCQQYFDDLVAIHDAFDREEVPVPEGFAENVMARVRETPQDGARRVIRFPRWQRWAALAACCAVAALGLWGAKTWMTAPGVASQTATANDAPVMVRSMEPDDTEDDIGYGVMAEADEVPVEAAPEMPEEVMDSVADNAAGGTEKRFGGQETEAALTDEYEEDLALAAVPALAADKPPEVFCGVITAGGPAARAWVEETLGQEWENGRTYPLTEEEYAGLLDALTAAGEPFQQEFGEQFQLLAAEDDPDTTENP